MNRAELKADAKEKMRKAPVNPYVFTIVWFVIMFVFSFLQGSVNAFRSNGLFVGSTSHTLSVVLPLIAFIVSTWLSFGYYAFCLKVSKSDESMAYADLFSAARYLLKALGLVIMVNIFTLLWALLFIIPGIIASFRYSQAIIIMVEDRDKGIFQCIRESKEMMAGHKMEYFILELSFFLWGILTIVTCGLALIYVEPYMTVTLTNYYLKIKPQ